MFLKLLNLNVCILKRFPTLRSQKESSAGSADPMLLEVDVEPPIDIEPDLLAPIRSFSGEEVTYRHPETNDVIGRTKPMHVDTNREALSCYCRLHAWLVETNL